MTYLKRFLAMLLGATVLPLRVIYHGLEFGAVALLCGAVALPGVPSLAAYILHEVGAPWLLNLFLTTFIVFPATAILVPLGLVAAACYMVYTTVVDVFKMAWLGLKNGFIDDLDGFRRTWNNQSSPLEQVSNLLRAYSNEVSVAHQINNEDTFNTLRMTIDQEPIDPRNTIDVLQHPLEVSDLQSSLLFYSDLLTEKQIKAAEQLVEDFSALDIPLPMGIKEQVKLLSKRTTNYKHLLGRMELVQDAILNNNPSAINDECVSMEVVTPIIIIKQYQTPDQVWHSVPANSYVTDKEVLLTWLRQRPTHPLNNDVLMSPTPYEGMPTRYKWDELTAKNCFSVPELQEDAVLIRGLLNTLPAQLVVAKRNTSSPGSTHQALFSVDLPAISQVGDEQHHPLSSHTFV